MDCIDMLLLLYTGIALYTYEHHITHSNTFSGCGEILGVGTGWGGLGHTPKCTATPYTNYNVCY